MLLSASPDLLRHEQLCAADPCSLVRIFIFFSAANSSWHSFFLPLSPSFPSQASLAAPAGRAAPKQASTLGLSFPSRRSPGPFHMPPTNRCQASAAAPPPPPNSAASAPKAFELCVLPLTSSLALFAQASAPTALPSPQALLLLRVFAFFRCTSYYLSSPSFSAV